MVHGFFFLNNQLKNLTSASTLKKGVGVTLSVRILQVCFYKLTSKIHSTLFLRDFLSFAFPQRTEPIISLEI